ncbi:signal transduction histidine kinase/CheY-like chemotaxis protein [Pedobacter sp. UYP24]
MPEKRHFFKGIKGKIILSLLLACLSLLTAWSVSKSVFQEMLNTVDNVSAPSARLALVNAISRNISSLDQQQKNQALIEPGNYNKIFKASSQLRKLIDSLSILYARDSVQTARILTIKRLLIERDKQFLNYLLIRSKLVNNKPLAEKMKQLNEVVSKSPRKKDSTILATEQKTSTTTFSPDDKKPRSLLDKIFGKNKESGSGQSFIIKSEEKIKRDTIALAAQDAMIKNIEQSLKSIENEQRQKNASFLNREGELASVNSKLTVQMLEVLRMVEGKVLTQIDLNAIQAKKVVNGGIDTITAIFLAFLLITVVLLYLILSDITRSNRYRQDLEVAKDEAIYHAQAKHRFLSNMSHEIRTPLQSIVGYTEIMKSDNEGNPAHIQAIYNSSEHLLQIVDEILDYNRIISGKFSFLNEAFSMSKLLDEIINVIKPQAENLSLTLITNFELNDLSLLKGDAFRLKQVVFNLLANAIKFTEKGEILLSVKFKKKLNNHHFTFTVADTGIGMSEEDTKRIFNEFEQVNLNQADLKRQSGAGLGLTIVKALIEDQGGRIYVKSEYKKGSTFTFYLTFDSTTETSKEKVETQLSRAPSYGKVWVVDDDPSILELCGIIFKKAAVEYRCFQSPIDLLEAKLDIDISHILMDIRMPEMNGEELCSQIRTKQKHHVKIIAVTAQVLPDERNHLLEKGFDALITKPFKSDQLLNAISIDQLSSSIDAEVGHSRLEKMTFGDSVLMKQILDQFTKDSIEDTLLIRTGLKENDLDKVSLVLHRIAGRTAQIGLVDLASQFRVMELRLREKSNEGINENRQEIFAMLSSLSHALKALQKDELNYSIS